MSVTVEKKKPHDWSEEVSYLLKNLELLKSAITNSAIDGGDIEINNIKVLINDIRYLDDCYNEMSKYKREYKRWVSVFKDNEDDDKGDRIVREIVAVAKNKCDAVNLPFIDEVNYELELFENKICDCALRVHSVNIRRANEIINTKIPIDGSITRLLNSDGLHKTIEQDVYNEDEEGKRILKNKIFIVVKKLIKKPMNERIEKKKSVRKVDKLANRVERLNSFIEARTS